MIKEPHPWGEFLKWRRKAMIWSKEKFGYSNAQIARNFSMDEMQVYHILEFYNHPLYNDEDAKKDD